VAYISLNFLFSRRVVLTFFHEISREYVRMFLHPVGVSLAEFFYLVSNIWHVEIMM